MDKQDKDDTNKQKLVNFVKGKAGDKQKLVLCFVGSAGNGKTTIAQHFVDLMPNGDVVKFAIATRLKNDAWKLFDIPPHFFIDPNLKDSEIREIEPATWSKNPGKILPAIHTPRQVLCLLGTGMRSLYPTYWIDGLIEDVNDTSDFKIAIIEDCHYENEIEALRQQLTDCLVLTVFVTRFLPPESSNYNTASMHESEQLAKTFEQHSDLVFDNCKNVEQITSIDQLLELIHSN